MSGRLPFLYNRYNLLRVPLAPALRSLSRPGRIVETGPRERATTGRDFRSFDLCLFPFPFVLF